ncbi:SMI1/KNR4 family protein [Blastopirellula marina]|uniref:Knr4/Smi1-like domain-containing protein n=1 Tax=Blastopirellula marina TaxID=124 RepID=A0A2S8GEP3_9BACT|nr:SMI1/KNR4 family protein [Blastopirellula marina]PQO42922.1 hypothetical protein C5Y93_24675 [Blastopirellula marina]
MMTARICETYPATTPAKLQRFERQFGVILPEDYSRFLLASNGGRPVPDGLDVPFWPGKSTRIHFFLGLHDGEHNNLASWMDELVDRLPDGCVPIAVDMGGNFLVLATRERRGQVYYWDASADYDLPEDSGTLFLLSNGINELLDGLLESPDT